MMVSEILKLIAEAVDRSVINFDHEDIDKYVAQGADIEETVLMTSFKEITNIGKFKTKHGLLEVNYNRMLPPNTMWLVRNPTSPAQTL